MQQFIAVIGLSLAIMAGVSALQNTDDAPQNIASAEIIPYEVRGKITPFK